MYNQLELELDFEFEDRTYKGAVVNSDTIIARWILWILMDEN